MLPNLQVWSLVTGILALSLTALDCIPAIRSIAHRLALKGPKDDDPLLAKAVYRDEDGEATEESLRAFSDKWQRVLISLCSISGFLITLALAVLTTPNIDVTILIWLHFGIWVRRTRSLRS